MIKKAVVVICLLFLVPLVYGQTGPAAPADIDNVVLQKVTQEHQATRKFLSDELTRQRTEFYNQFDERAVFYEKEFFDTLRTAVIKLSLIWGAVVFFVFGLNNLMRITLEKKRFRRMKETIKDELKVEMFLRNPPQPQPQQKTVFEQRHSPTAAYSYQAPPIYQTPIKEGYFARRKKRKIAQQIEAIEKEQARQATKAALLRQKMGGPMVPPGQQSWPQGPYMGPQGPPPQPDYRPRGPVRPVIPDPPEPIPKVEVYQ